MSKKMDRRVARTRRRLQEALLSLILEKGYDETTVQDILNRADVGRSTFYSHYLNKADLLLGNMRDEDFRLFSSDAPAELPDVAWLFKHAGEHLELYRALKHSEVMPVIYRNISDGLQRNWIELLTRMKADGRMGDLPVNATASYLSNALIGLLVWWLDNWMPIEADDMNALFTGLVERGLRPASA